MIEQTAEGENLQILKCMAIDRANDWSSRNIYLCLFSHLMFV